ncbi:MAG: adenosylcobinamide-GDP ribazoletransferase [Acidimicrobiales bacterium]|nr:MAG: adenosylcobinamide-GDP ribazoletransferase [Acidimicrobiales bacterium]
MMTSLGLLTILPGRGVEGDPRWVRWFPVVGVLLGVCVGVVWTASEAIWSAPIAGVLAVAADAALTGGMHYDALADGADGLLPAHLSRRRRLEIMEEPTLGTFGCLALAITVLSRVFLFSEIAPNVLVTAGLWAASRTVMGIAPAFTDCARPGGLGALLDRPRVARQMIPLLLVGSFVTLGTMAWAGPASAVAASVASLAAAAACTTMLAVRRLGGHTGDVLGAAGLVGETAGLLAWAAVS